MKIEYLHTMVRVKDIEASKAFYCDLLYWVYVHS